MPHLTLHLGCPILLTRTIKHEDGKLCAGMVLTFVGREAESVTVQDATGTSYSIKSHETQHWSLIDGKNQHGSCGPIFVILSCSGVPELVATIKQYPIVPAHSLTVSKYRVCSWLVMRPNTFITGPVERSFARDASAN